MGLSQSFLAVIFSLSVFSAIKTFSQVVSHSYVLYGIVQTKEDKTPIENALVYQSRRSRILNFATTNEAGVFELTLSTYEGDSSMLVIRSLGYEDYQILLSDIVIRSMPLSFLLSESVKQLSEVIIRSREERRLYNDTTTILIRDVDPSVKTLENLLATLPDFRVSEDGSVYYRGKELSKIYVEGADLTSFNYKRLSKSIPADFIEAVDVIERFVENKLLGGLVSSDAVVLNLKIDPSRYGKVFGDVRLSYGNRNYRNMGLNNFLIGQYYKGYAQVNHNNTGDRYDPQTAELFRLIRAEGYTTSTSMSPFLSIRAPLNPISLTNINNETQVGITQVFSSAPDSLSITVDMSYLQDRIKPVVYDSLSITVNPETGDNFFLSANRLTDNRLRNFYFRNRYQWNFRAGQKLDIQYQLNSSRSIYLNSIYQRLFAQGTMENDVMKEDFYTTVLQHNFTTEWTKRTGPSKAFQWVHHFLSYDYPQRLTLSSSLNRFPVQPDSVFLNNLNQYIANRVVEYSTNFRIFKVANRIQYAVGAETVLNRNSISRQIRDTISEIDFVQTSFENVYGGLSFEYNLSYKALRWNNVFTYRVQRFRLGESLYIFQYPVIRSDFDWRVSSRNRLEVNGIFDVQFPSASDVVGFHYGLNFNQFRLGLGEVVRRNHIGLNVTYSFTLKPRFLEIQTQFTFERYKPDLFSNLLIDEYVQIQKLQGGKRASGATGFISLSKFFPDISFRFRVSSSLESSSFFNLINNNEFRKNNVIQLRHKISTGTAFNIPVNLFWDFSVVDLIASTSFNQDLFESQNSYYQSKLTFKYQLKKINLLADHEYLVINTRRFDVVGFSLTYKVPQASWEAFLYGRNLINNTNYTFILQNDFSFTQTKYQLLHAMVVAGFRMKF